MFNYFITLNAFLFTPGFHFYTVALTMPFAWHFFFLLWREITSCHLIWWKWPVLISKFQRIIFFCANSVSLHDRTLTPGYFHMNDSALIFCIRLYITLLPSLFLEIICALHRQNLFGEARLSIEIIIITINILI